MRNREKVFRRLVAGWLSLVIMLSTGGLTALSEEYEDEDLVSLLEGNFDENENYASFGENDEEIQNDWVAYDYNNITIGNATKMHGQFFTGLWGNSTSDLDVRYLLHDYNLIEWDRELGLFRINHSVVSGAMQTENPDGSRSYLLSLYDDLYYSDGSHITAWDYAFSVLFQCDPVIEELGGTPADFSYLEGYEAYIAGEAQGLIGLRVADDYILVFTVKEEAFPYFYEMFRLSFNPYPIKVIAPGCKVYDQGEGVFIGNEDGGDAPLFTADLLRQTVMDPVSGYLSHPSVTSGPYRLMSYDGDVASFVINTYYKGNEEGKKPQIWYLNYTLADNEDMVQQLAEGKFALLNKVTMGQTINDGLQLTQNREEQFTRSNYPRIGLTFMVFEPDSKIGQDLKVRQAIAHCLQKDDLVAGYVGSYGLGMDAFYGLGQWMYSLAVGTILPPVELPENATALQTQEYEEALAAWEDINLDGITQYDTDVEEAIRLLEEAGWVLNEAGEAYQQGTDSPRYRLEEGVLIPLRLRMAIPLSPEAMDGFEKYLVPNLRAAGIELIIDSMDMDSLVDAYHHSSLEQYDMFYLGDDFNIAFDPSHFFRPGEGEELEGTLAEVHAELNELCQEMTRTEPTDVLGFMQKWLAFQERFSELLPMIPVYGNVYFDFYTRELHDYMPAEHVSWARAIIDAYMDEVDYMEEEEIEELEGEFDEMEETFFFDD